MIHSHALIHITDNLFIQEFCFADCHLLADICYEGFTNMGYSTQIITCYDPSKRHTFVELTINDTVLYLDGSGVHSNQFSVFAKYGVSHQGQIRRLPIVRIYPDDERHQSVIKKSFRYQALLKSYNDTHIPARFNDVRKVLFNQYLALINWPHLPLPSFAA
jgi:hypothetical protein